VSLDPLRRPEVVAPDLLGWTIACRGAAAVITEVEAYHQDEPAAHSHGGVATERTRDLFGAAGTAYVYRSYGIHLCMNVVTGPTGSGEAVLLRAGMVVRGEDLVRSRRAAGRGIAPDALAPGELLTGPGRLAQGLDIRPGDSGSMVLELVSSGVDDVLGRSDLGPVVVRDPEVARTVGIDLPVREGDLLVGPRIGITKAVDLPWRFGVRGAHLSRPFAISRRTGGRPRRA
jgi:DNA-3-methyladenine glycosylase